MFLYLSLYTAKVAILFRIPTFRYLILLYLTQKPVFVMAFR